MTPLERLQASLAKLQDDGCRVEPTVQRTNQDYKQQSAQADRHLQEKQRQERKKRGWT